MIERLAHTLNRCYRHVAFFEVIVWLFLAFCGFVLSGTFVLPVVTATIGVIVVFFPLVFSQTIIGFVLGAVGIRISFLSGAAYLAGIMVGATVLAGAFWLLFHIPVVAFFSLAPMFLVAILLRAVQGLYLWLLVVAIQALMFAFSWLRLRSQERPVLG